MCSTGHLGWGCWIHDLIKQKVTKNCLHNFTDFVHLLWLFLCVFLSRKIQTTKLFHIAMLPLPSARAQSNWAYEFPDRTGPDTQVLPDQTYISKHFTYQVWVHTCKNLIPMLVTRAMANSSKNHALLMCRIRKMGWNLFSSLDIRENPLFVLFPA